MTEQREIWERLPGESPAAFEAFRRYRDMPASSRSIDSSSAADGIKNTAGGSRKRARSSLFKWSSRFRWLERVGAFDDHRDRLLRLERDRVALELVRRRQTLEAERFDLWKRHTERLLEDYEQARKMPRTDASQKKWNDEGRLIHQAEVKGLPPRELKALTEALEIADRIATHGHPKITKSYRVEPGSDAPKLSTAPNGEGMELLLKTYGEGGDTGSESEPE